MRRRPVHCFVACLAIVAPAALLLADPAPAPLVPLPLGWSGFSAINAPSARFRHTATDVSSLTVVWGGTADGVTGLNTGAMYDATTDSWTPTTPAGAPAGRFNHTGTFVFNSAPPGEIVYFGGEGSPPKSDGAKFDPFGGPGGTWTGAITDLFPTGAARTRHAAAVLEDDISPPQLFFVHGGLDAGGNSLGDSFMYDLGTDIWTPLVASPLAARHDHTATNLDALSGFGEVFVFGGAQATGGVETTAFNDGSEYDNAGPGSWGSGGAFGVARARHTAVRRPSPVPTEVAIFGGDVLGVPTGTGIRYNDAADTFSAMSMTGAPTARTRHSAVFFSTPSAQMIVFGGENPGTPTNTGGHYFFQDDCWVATETAGAPSPRSLHTANFINTGVAIGMLVFGGTNGASPLGDGGRYNCQPAPPFVQFAQPIGVTTAGGAQIRLFGSNLTGLKAVRFQNGSAAYNPNSGTAAPGFSLVSDFEAVAVAPALGFTGPVHVEIERCGGGLNEIRRAITSTNSTAVVSGSFAAGSTVAAYRMRSLPFFASHEELLSMLQGCLGPYDPRVWRAFAWEAAAQGYVELPGLAANDPTGDATGRGVFLISARDLTCDFVGLNTDPATNFYVVLEPGFNMVSLPSSGTIAWSSVNVGFKGEGSTGANDVPASSANAFISQVLFAYDGTGYASATAMVGGESYWVFNKTGFRVVLFIPDPAPKAGEGVQQSYGPIPEGAPTPPPPPGAVEGGVAESGAVGGGGGGGGDSATQVVGAAGSVLALAAVTVLAALKRAARPGR